ncbi:MAG TPA: phospholipase D-like domain-containing protein [Candidatus Binataceae bacterium]|nr:phospholipase D-like domain-containing protein [Candidatus Binataceae bacterium]
MQQRQKTPTDILDRHLALEQSLSGEPLVLGNKVTLLENGTATYRAMLDAIHGARDTINLQMYIISDGRVGQMFADALIERRQHGVQVNVIYDSLGSMHTSASFFDQLQSHGISVLQYRPINPFEAKLPWSLMHRNHRKMLVVDGRIAFTGGINISEVYASGLRASKASQPPQYWRDTDIQVEGPVVAQFQHLFVDEWRYQKGAPLGSRNYFPHLEPKGTAIVRVIGSVPERFSLIYITLLSAIVNSQTNVHITDAYFAPDRQILHVLEHAARRGVDVRLLLPSQSDEPLVVSAQRSDYEQMLKSGVKIYEWQGKMLHAKTATIDGVWSTVGTSNLDWWSIARDNELNAVILSHSFGDRMDLMFRNDMEGSQPIDLEEWERRGLLERLDETIAWLLEPLL